jgi:hypothetical protein
VCRIGCIENITSYYEQVYFVIVNGTKQPVKEKVVFVVAVVVV